MLDKHFAKNKDVPWRIIEEEAVLVDVESGNVIQLNEVGALIWEAIDGKNKVGDIVNRVCSKFEVGEQQARVDVQDFIKEMQKKEIVIDA